MKFHGLIGGVFLLMCSTVVAPQAHAEAPVPLGKELVIYKKFHRHVTRAHTENLAARASTTGLPIKSSYGRVGTLADASQDYAATCAAITTEFPDLGCEPNKIVSIQNTPNDAYFPSLTGMPEINASTAWGLATESSAIVAVIDTGVDSSHSDLAANMVAGYDFVDNDSDPYDLNGHGTHVSGTIGAAGNNGIGVAGVCWRVKIMPVRVLDASGSGSLAAVAQGIEYAVNHGASVLNLSLGGQASTSVLRDAFNLAENAGVVASIAAGNYGYDNDETNWYPANYTNENIISVAASDGTDLAYFSHYGRTSVDLAAPGVNVLSTLPGSAYGYESGTSMAAPHVAGAAALLKGSNSNLSATQIKSLLLSTVSTNSNFSGKMVSGGILNIGAAMQSALGVVPAAVEISIKRVKRNSTVTIFGKVTEASVPAARRLGLYKNSRLLKVTNSSSVTGKYNFRTTGRGKFQVKDTFSTAASKALKVK